MRRHTSLQLRMAPRTIVRTSCCALVSASALLLFATTAATAVATPANATSEAADTLESWYEGQFRANETYLLGLPSEPLMGLLSEMNSSSRAPPCRGMPSIQVRSSAGANNGCSALFTSWGAACTCLEGYVPQDKVWEFNVKKKAQTVVVNPLTLTSGDVLEIDVIQTLLVPYDLERLYVCGLCGDRSQAWVSCLTTC